MSPYPLLDDLELQVRAGRGVAVIVEGESAEDDAWFYGQWFGNRAREVTFFPQDGWQQVTGAVTSLRERCPEVPVYGIIDRDFTEEAGSTPNSRRRPADSALHAGELPARPGLLGARFSRHFRASGAAPNGWDEPDRVSAYIADAYRACLDLAAYNLVVKHACVTYRDMTMQTPERDRTYRDHPDAFREVPPDVKLAAWAERMGCPESQVRVSPTSGRGWRRWGPPPGPLSYRANMCSRSFMVVSRCHHEKEGSPSRVTRTSILSAARIPRRTLRVSSTGSWQT